jgi:hypothetical protein
MAKVTSSSDRSKRTASKRPTSSATRATRSNASSNSSSVTSSATRSKRVAKAVKDPFKVTGRGGRPASTGEAKVTTGKPVGTPRAITNGSSPAMRQLRAKAVQANRQAQGRLVIGGTKGRTLTPPNSAKSGTNLIKAGADKARVIGDSGKVRAAQASGKAASEGAKIRRMLASASKGTSAASKLGRLGALGAAVKILDAGPVADGTLKGKPMRAPAKGPNAKEKATAANFGKSFKAARAQGSKEFMYRGKRYTTKRKDGK